MSSVTGDDVILKDLSSAIICAIFFLILFIVEQKCMWLIAVVYLAEIYSVINKLPILQMIVERLINKCRIQYKINAKIF